MNEVVIKLIGNYSYQTTHCLGEGVYGKVYEGMERDTKEKVAIKKVDLNTFNNDKYLENAVFSEIYLLKRFNHPNIVKFKDVLSSKNSLYIITEFCRHGDLKEMIKRKRFRQDQAFDVIKQIICGFSQLVQEKIIHRDLKPANILINDNIYKIGDFGFAKYVDNFGSQMLKSCVGSPIYMAPQLLERTPYTTKCDIWSIGIIFYEMLFGTPPWKARDENELLKNIKNIPITQIVKKQFLSSRASQFLKKTLAYSEEDRISWSDLFDMFMPKGVTQDDSGATSATSTNQSIYRNRYMTTVGSTPTSNRSSNPVGTNTSIGPRKDLSRQYPNNQSSLTSLNSINPINTTSAPLILEKKPTSTHSISSSSNYEIMKRTREECAFKHFVCTEMYANHSQLKDMGLAQFQLNRFIYLLSYSIKIRGSYTLGMLAHYAKQSKIHEELHLKMSKEQESYDELQRDIQQFLQGNQIIKKIKEELSSCIGSRLDIINEDRINKVQQLLFQSVVEVSTILLEEIRKKSKSLKDSQLVQIVQWLADIMTLWLHKEKGLQEISLMVRTDDSDTPDYANRVCSRIDSILSAN